MPHAWVRLTREPWYKRWFRFGHTDEVFISAAVLGGTSELATSRAA